MTQLAPMFASEANAARLLDMKPAQFRELVREGHLPPPRRIGAGMERWDMHELRRILSGAAVDGMADVDWTP